MSGLLPSAFKSSSINTEIRDEPLALSDHLQVSLQCKRTRASLLYGRGGVFDQRAFLGFFEHESRCHSYQDLSFTTEELLGISTVVGKSGS